MAPIYHQANGRPFTARASTVETLTSLQTQQYKSHVLYAPCLAIRCIQITLSAFPPLPLNLTVFLPPSPSLSVSPAFWEPVFRGLLSPKDGGTPDVFLLGFWFGLG